MRAIHSFGLLAGLFLVSGEARPCGGAFGSSYTIQPAQKIVVSYRNGVETYVFNPNFCGKADSFGLILPVPKALTASPTLGTQQLYADLATVAAPTVVTTQQCGTRAAGGAASTGVGGGANGGGTAVIQRGQVGIFDWALLQATSVESFTAWLTANGFPFPATATTTFQSYVDGGWYFVAFKVSPGGATGSAGAAGVTTISTATICGSFGPVSLSFPTSPNPVIPARIASVSSTSLSWDIFAVGSSQLRMQGYSPTLMFSGAISASELSSYPSLAQIAQAGDRLTELLLTSMPATDLILESDPNQADYRRVVNQVQYVTCSTGGASTGGASTGGKMSFGGQVSFGGVATGGVATGGRSSTGGTVIGIGGNTMTKDGGATGVESRQAGAPAVDTTPATGCGCSVPSMGQGVGARGLAFAGLFGALAALRRRRRSVPRT